MLDLKSKIWLMETKIEYQNSITLSEDHLVTKGTLFWVGRITNSKKETFIAAYDLTGFHILFRISIELAKELFKHISDQPGDKKDMKFFKEGIENHLK